jgi:oligopeptide transport system substrate-binding protein
VRAFALIFLCCWACGGDGGSDLPSPIAGAGLPGPRYGGTLRIGLISQPRTFDPAIAFDEMSYQIEHAVFDTLVAYAPASSANPLELVPQLAESWTISPDRLTYAFTLREGLRYHDGTPIVAADFVTALDRVLSPAVPSPGKQYYAKIVGAAERQAGTAESTSGLRALDDRHLEIRLLVPDESFLYMLSLKFATPIPARHLAAVGERIRDQPLASGPFHLVEWREGSRMRFEKNPHYWRQGIPYLDGIDAETGISRDMMGLKLLRGEYDAIDRISADKYLQLMKSDEWRDSVRLTSGTVSYGEMMNVDKPPFNGPNGKKVRQAMNYAIDKQKTVRIYNGRAEVAHGLLPPMIPGYDPARKPYPYDPDKARQLLAEAGYPDGFELTYYMVPDELYVLFAESVQADLLKVGVRIKIQTLDFPTYLAAVGRHELTFCFTGWFMDFPHPLNFLETKFHSRSISGQNSTNDSGWHSEETDRLMDQARIEPDPVKAMAMYRRVDEIIFEEAPWIWHYYPKITEVVQPYLKGYKYHPVHLRDYREAWLDKAGTRTP